MISLLATRYIGILTITLWKAVMDMNRLTVCLLGKFSARRDQHDILGLDVTKIQYLFCYLLLYRSRSHLREALATLLWGDSTTVQSKKYLRQALWQLQSALNTKTGSLEDYILTVEPDWIGINSKADLSLDVEAFERHFSAVQGVPGHDLDDQRAQSLKEAERLYRGDLMTGCFEEWCLYERERLQNIYLSMLDKLMSYCEAQSQYETGIQYGSRILGYDRAREHTHRKLMRLHFLAGDRSGALRQHERCVEALQEELGVKPGKKTMVLYAQIRADQLDDATPAPAQIDEVPVIPMATAPLHAVLSRLRKLRTVLTSLQHQTQEDIHAVELVLKDRR
jgi:DNA-binding SARP family transcriptional activator